MSSAHRVWPNSAIPGQLPQDLPTPTHFARRQPGAARRRGLADHVRSDPGPVVDAIHSYEEAGLDYVHLHQIGPDQEGFFRFWTQELAPKL